MQNRPAAVPVTSLKRQGAIKVKNGTDDKIVLPKRDPGSYIEEKISTPYHTLKSRTLAAAVPLEQHGAIREENTPHPKG